MKSIFTILSLLITTMLFSQGFHENFETTPLKVSSYSTGTGNWDLNTRIQSQGLKSDSCVVNTGDTTYLTTQSFTTLGKYSVIFEFDQIAKIEFYDQAFIEYSTDSSAWSRLTGSNYLGNGGFANYGHRFYAGSYTDWIVQDTFAVPQNTWWKHEVFDLSNIVSDTPHVWLRFVLIEGVEPIAQTPYLGTSAWFLDSLKVVATLSEMVPPTITLLSPIIKDTAYTVGPYNIGAEIFDNSGLDTAICIYTVMPENITDTLQMVLNSSTIDSFYCNIPFYGYGRTISYYVKARDASIAHNEDSTSIYSFFCKNSPGGTFVVGNASSTSSPTIGNPFGQLWTGNKNQFLILASELQAMGAAGGNITSLAFDVVTTNAATSTGSNHDGFTIKIKTTSASALGAAFETSLTQVFTTTTYQTVVGWNTFTFSTPFVWDGVSNLIVETCFDNGANNWSGNAAIHRTTTTFNSVTNKYSDAATNTCLESTGTTSKVRPDMKIVLAAPSGLSNDIGVYQIVNPYSGVPASTVMPVNVNLKNFGIDTVTTATINWKYDGALQPIHNFTDSLKADSVSSTITLGSLTPTPGPHNLLVWSSAPNGGFDNDISNDSASFDFFACTGPLSGPYTIGGASSDFNSISDAALALNQCGISGDVVFNIANGVYNEQIVLGPIPGASTSNSIIFKSTSGDSSTVTMRHDAITASDNYVVKLEGASYIEFKQMTFEASDALYSRVIVMGDSSHDVSFINNAIKNTDTTSIINSDAAIVFAMDSTIGNNILISNNFIENGSYGVYLLGDTTNGGPINWKIKNNIIKGHSILGVQLVNAVSPEIISNEISADTNASSGSYQGVYLFNNKGTALISKNKILTISTELGYGIRLSNCIFDTLAPATIVNNFVQLHGSATGTNLSACILIHDSKNVNVYYNNVRHTGAMSNATAITLYAGTAGNVSGLDIVNNNFTNNAGGYIYYVLKVDTSLWNNSNNNLYNYNKGTAFSYLGGAITSFTAWETATGGTNLYNNNPYFSSATDLHVNNGILDGAAMPIASVLDDIDDTLRSLTTPDIGADEFIPSPWDATAIEILSPIGSCGLTNAEVVTLRIKNVGSAAITNGLLSASYKLLGGTVVTVVTESVTINTPIAPGDTLDYIFATTADLDIYSTGKDSIFAFSAWVTLTNDLIHENDSTSLDVFSGFKPVDVVVSDTIISYGDSVVITAQHTDTIFDWYESDTSLTELYTGTSFATPALFDTTTYWVGVKASSPGFSITEICQFKYTVGAPSAGWPAYLSADDYIEISGAPNADLSGYVLEQWFSTSMANTFTFPAGTILSPNGTAIIAVGASAGVASPSNFYYIGNTSTGWSSSSVAGRILKKPNGVIMDAVGVNGFVFPAAANVPASEWSSSPIGGGSTSGFRLIGADDNTGTNWIVSSSSNTQDPNTFNTGVVIPLYRGGCESNRVPLHVNVINIPTVELGIASISTNLGCDLTNAESVTIDIYNQGYVDAVDSINVSFRVDANTFVVQELVPDTIKAGDTVSYTFTATADLYAPLNDTFYIIEAYVTHPQDVYSLNDTLNSGFIASLYTPSAPIVTDTTIDFASMVTIPSSSPDYVYWYVDDTTSTEVHIGANYTSPLLFDTTVYWVEANTSAVNNSLACHSPRVSLTVSVTAQPTLDAAISSIQSPATGFELSAVENVQVMVVNHGLDSITNFPIAYVIDSQTPVVDTFANVLHSGDTALFTFAVPADLSAYGFYNVKAYTMLPSDTCNLDDTLEVQVENKMIVYCTSGATSVADDDIGNVTFGGINNTSPSPYNGTYSDYTNIAPGQIAPGLSYPISIDIVFSGSFTYAGYCEVYIDYNHDGVFSEPSEIAFGAAYTGVQTLTGTVVVPSNTYSGLTRMRVVAREYSNASSVIPCGTYSWGETEDYLVNLVAPLPQDAGVIEIIAPLANAVLNENASTPVEVVVKNYGTDTITSMDIDYVINNGTPIVFAYNDTLIPGVIDTVSLYNFNSPAGNSTICAYTVLLGDSNNFNDTTCVNFYGTPTTDAYLTEIVEIMDGCALGTDTISIWIKNIGIDTINGVTGSTMTASYQIDGASTTVTETMGLTIDPTDSVLFSFAALVDFSVTTTDSLFNIVAWVNLTGDNVAYNDTAISDVNSLHTPGLPVVTSPMSVPYASTATLTATSPTNDTLIWYDSLFGGSVIGGGASYTTSLMYNTDTFYVQAGMEAGGSSLLLTEINLGTTDAIEIQNISGSLIDATGWVVAVSNSYSVINNVNPQLWNLGVIQPGDVLYKDDNFSSSQYWGSNLLWNPGPYPTFAGWAMIIDNNGEIVDFIAWGWQDSDIQGFGAVINGFNITIGSEWIGNGVSNPTMDYINRVSYDLNTNADFVNASSGTMGAANPSMTNLGGGSGTGSCASNRAPLIVNVMGQPASDVGAYKILAPLSAVNLTSSELVKVRVRNFGSASQSNIPMAYSVDGGAIVLDTITSTVAANDSIDFTFGTTADLSTQGHTYSIMIYSGLSSDANHLNDTIVGSAMNMMPVYCISKANSSADSKVDNVILNTINNNTASSGCATYSDFTSISTVLSKGASYTMSVTLGTCGGNYTKGAKAWIDYNRDGDFDDAGEEIANFGQGNSTTTYTATVTIPANALSGTTRMRVVGRETPGTNNGSINPCGTYTYGETEDYSVVILTPIPNDAGVEMIISPSNLVSVSTLPAEVRIRNYGTDTITSVDIAYVLNGASQVVTTYNAAPIYPMDSVDVSLGMLSLQSGNNTFTVHTILPNDTNYFNDAMSTNIYLQATVNLTYTDDFEGSGLWLADTIVNQWELGVPAMTNINTAHSPVNVWGIDLDGNYANGSDDYLYSPFMVTTGLDSANLKFWHYYNAGTDDGGAVEISLNRGSWITLGVLNDVKGTNWYNTNIGGNPFWSGNSNGWVESTYMINFALFLPAGVNSADTIQLRYHFRSNSSGNSNDGWAIDDVSIELPKVATNGGVIAITNPIGSTTTGSSVTVGITVKNFGTSPLMTIPVVYTVGTVVETATIVIPSPGLQPDSTIDYTFTNTYVGPNADYNICAETNITGDPYQQDDQWCEAIIADKAPIDVNVFGITVNPAWADTTKITYVDTLTMHIENKGTTAITAMVLEYKVGNSVKQSVNWTGNLASGDTLDYTFATTFNSPINWYAVSASATLANDADLSNNEFSHNYYGMNDIGFENNNGDIFSVDQNQPNPAHGKVVVNYNLPKSGKVHFELRNALGQVIMNQEYERSVGNNQIEIDATQLSSGIYYYTVEFDKQRITKKMVVNN